MPWILTVFENFTWFTVAMPIQGCGVTRSQRVFGGVGFQRHLGSESDFLSDSDNPIGSLLHHTPKLGILVELAQFLMKLLWNRILAVYHGFHWVLVATKLLAAKLHSLYVKKWESEISERLEWKFWKGRSWSQTFYLRLRNPECHSWMMASISLVMVVRSNFCNRDFFIDHKFSMGLGLGEFPG